LRRSYLRENFFVIDNVQFIAGIEDKNIENRNTISIDAI